LSRMRRKSQVRFLGGGEVAIPPCYPAGRCLAVASGGGFAHDLTPLVWRRGAWSESIMASEPEARELAVIEKRQNEANLFVALMIDIS
jgi:hypothetical protein